MRTFRTLLVLRSDWLMGKWSILIGREQISRDQMERSYWLIQKLGGWSKPHPPKDVRGFVWADKRRCDWFNMFFIA